MTPRPSHPAGSKTLLTRLLRLLLGLLLLAVLLLALLPVLVSSYAEGWLNRWATQHGLDGAQIGEVRLSAWNGSLEIDALVLRKDGEPLLSIPHARLRIRPMALLEQRLLVEELRLSGVRLSASGDGEGHLQVAGIPVAVPSDWALGAEGVSAELDSAWQVLLAQATLDDLSVHYVDDHFRAKVHINRLRLSDHGQLLHIGRIDVEDAAAVLVLTADQRLRSRGLLQWALFGNLHATGDQSPEFSPDDRFEFQLDELRLNDGNQLRFIDERLGNRFDITLAINSAVWSGLDSRHPQRPSKLHGTANFGDGTALRIDGQLHLFAELAGVDFVVKVQKLPLARLAAYTEAMQGKAAQTGHLSTTVELRLQRGNHRIRVRSAEIDGLRLSLNADAAGELRLAKLPLGRPLEHTAGAAFTSPISGPAVAFTIDELLFTDAEVSYREPGFGLRIATNRLQLAPGKHLIIDTLDLLDLKLDATLDRQGHWQADGIVRRLLFAATAEPGTEPAAVPDARPVPMSAGSTVQTDNNAGAPAAFDLRIRALNIAGNSNIAFTDHTFQPPFTLRLGALHFSSIARDDDGGTNSPARTSLDLRLGRHGKIQLRGTTSQRMPHLNMELAGSMRSLELPQWSAYSEEGWGFAIVSGQVEGKMQLRTDDGHINGTLEMDIHGLAIETRDAKRLAELEQDLPVSLDTAIGLITEDDGSIPLRLNFNGDINHPELGFDFDLDGAINRALGDITQTAIVVANPLTLALYALFSDPGEDPIDPVLFAPGQSELNRRATQWLAQVGNAMQGNPEIRIRACGRSVAADLPGGVSSFANAAAAERVALAKLAQRRGQVVKDYLVEKIGINASQVIACSGGIEEPSHGDIDDDDAGEFPGQGGGQSAGTDADSGQPRTDLLL